MQKIKSLICNNICNSEEVIEDIAETKRILSKNLFQITPLNKSISRDILSLAYTPGVGEVCMELKENPQKADILTFRGRSVAIVSDGSMLNSEGRKFMPAMDWFIVQLKYYAGVDAFPFVVRN
jgi:malate dehydrogenase (oxaloacetate-decarboxylating)